MCRNFEKRENLTKVRVCFRNTKCFKLLLFWKLIKFMKKVEEGICSESISCYTAELQCALNVTNPICDCDHLRSLVSDCRDFKESIPTNSLALALIGGIVYYIVVEALDYFAIRPFAVLSFFLFFFFYFLSFFW